LTKFFSKEVERFLFVIFWKTFQAEELKSPASPAMELITSTHPKSRKQIEYGENLVI
jgi:hypothetical protein